MDWSSLFTFVIFAAAALVGIAQYRKSVAPWTHCYEITHGGIRMWPPGWRPAVSEAEALAQMEHEECGSLGDIQLWRHNLVFNEASGEIIGYDPSSRQLLATKQCLGCD